MRHSWICSHKIQYWRGDAAHRSKWRGCLVHTSWSSPHKTPLIRIPDDSASEYIEQHVVMKHSNQRRKTRTYRYLFSRRASSAAVGHLNRMPVGYESGMVGPRPRHSCRSSEHSTRLLLIVKLHKWVLLLNQWTQQNPCNFRKLVRYECQGRQTIRRCFSSTGKSIAKYKFNLCSFKSFFSFIH